jgi:hypothetical protein
VKTIGSLLLALAVIAMAWTLFFPPWIFEVRWESRDGIRVVYFPGPRELIFEPPRPSSMELAAFETYFQKHAIPRIDFGLFAVQIGMAAFLGAMGWWALPKQNG